MNKYLLSGIALLLSGYAFGQGTVEDYNRAYAVRNTFSAKQVYYSQVVPTWTERGMLFGTFGIRPTAQNMSRWMPRNSNARHCSTKRNWLWLWLSRVERQ